MRVVERTHGRATICLVSSVWRFLGSTFERQEKRRQIVSSSNARTCQCFDGHIREQEVPQRWRWVRLIELANLLPVADQRTTVLGMKRFKANGKHLELTRDLVLTPCRDLHSDCWAKIPNRHAVARNNSDPARDYHHIHARGFSTQLCQQTGPNAKRNNTFFFRRRTCFLTRKILRRRVVQKDGQTSLMQCFLTFCVHKSSWLCTKRCVCSVELFA